MIAANLVPNLNILTDTRFTTKELAFIFSYLATGNASQAVREAGYNSKAPDKYATTNFSYPGR